MSENTYRLWVNEERTVLVRLWDANDTQLGPPTLGDREDEMRRHAVYGTVEVATRESPDHTWGPPVYLTEERT